MQGEMKLIADGQDSQLLLKGDAFVVPPDLRYQISNVSDDLELLEVSLPGEFKTKIH